MRYSESSNFSTSSLRKTLQNYIQKTPDFEEQKMGCAVETFEHILSLIHDENLSSENQICDCPTHKFFTFNYFQEQYFLFSFCCETSSIELKSDHLLRIYSRDLEDFHSMKGKNNLLDLNEIFSHALNQLDDGQKCEKCSEEKILKKWAKFSQVLGISIVWDPEGWKFFSVVLRSLKEILELRIFDRDLSEKFILRGIVCFGFNHYSAFVYEVEENSWYQVDDHLVRKMRGLGSVVQLMEKKKSLPVLLLYEFFSESYQNVYIKNQDIEFFEDFNNTQCFDCSLL
jgi:hypothetical protein